MDGPIWIYLLFGAALFIAGSVGGIAVVAYLLVRLPADYFCDSHARDFWRDRHPVIRQTGLIVKNLLGGVLVAFGVLLSLPGIPGPGVLTILFGVVLLDIPGKRRFERWLIGQPAVLQTVNRLRHRHHKPPFTWTESTGTR